MISVIIPNKKGREIRTDLSSQIFKDFELIVIKDKELRGQSWALNRGIEKAKFDYLMFLDDDLDLEPNILKELYEALKGTTHSLAYCNFNKKGVINGVHRANNWDVEHLKRNNYISNCSMVVKKDFPGFDEDIFKLKDWDVWLTMAENKKTGVWVDKVLFTAHYAEDGISVVNDFQKHKKIIFKKHDL